ncbi:MAG: 2-C-methyl-D-erythritol 4-phosphate cytidylyltransferase [Mycoplasmatales bacterium]|nr:2-C-methyl-D-erythritol 4-phosphate cytidylyltransferase [Mycoplasmatales bacterium]
MKKLIMLSGGIGKRTLLSIPKQYHKIKGKPIIEYLLTNIADFFDQIYIVADFKEIEGINFGDAIIVENGSERIDSLRNGLNAANIKDEDFIYIHEAVRPNLFKEDLELHLFNLKKGESSVTVESVVDTMFKIEDGIVKEAIAKKDIVRGFNPQSYPGSTLKRLLNEINEIKEDKDLIEIAMIKNIKIKAINQINDLRKITTPDDIKWFEDIA